MQNKKIIKEKWMQPIKIVILGLLFSLGIGYIQAQVINTWTTPPSSGGANNVAELLNVGGQVQVKQGNMGTGTYAPSAGFKLDVDGTMVTNGLLVRGVTNNYAGIPLSQPKFKILNGGNSSKLNSTAELQVNGNIRSQTAAGLAHNGLKKPFMPICANASGKIVLCP